MTDKPTDDLQLAAKLREAAVPTNPIIEIVIAAADTARATMDQIGYNLEQILGPRRRHIGLGARPTEKVEPSDVAKSWLATNHGETDKQRADVQARIHAERTSDAANAHADTQKWVHDRDADASPDVVRLSERGRHFRR